MESVIVTIKRQGEAQYYDLDVPIDTTAGSLAQQVASALDWGGNYEIHASPPGQILEMNKSLADSGVWDGAYLIFQTIGSMPTLKGSNSNPPISGSTPSNGPVSGWKPLDPPPSPPASGEIPPSNSSGGFTWKRIDED